MGFFDAFFGKPKPPPGASPRLDAPLRVSPHGEFPVRLDDAGPNKIAVIKAAREMLGLDLKATKDLVESAPVIVVHAPSHDAARAVVRALAAAGATASTVGADTSTPDAGGASQPVLRQGEPRERVVVLDHAGPNLIAVIKVLRQHLGLDLASCKGFVDRAPSRLPSLDEEQALALMMALSDAGARVDID